ncbi:MAG: succinoglycan biosynthesis protein [Rhodospirillales bacterium CG15_BIG_FIL_POST_REV_8_21_14_020_66_15]|nr:MAG: succinoglycan biosynthesis protein [Rhodospirillales bacterium CG15_BIG_FIL_POST_REV_8_21_14_020_66_15]
MRSLLICLLLLSLAGPARADMEGQPNIVDGDTLSVAGVVFNLHGIDAPENDQTCDKDGERYPCGFQAANALGFMTAYQWVQCRDKGVGRDGRYTMTCYLGGRYDVGERLIRQGWALYDRALRIPAYVAAEEAARAERAGLWAGAFVPPWEWRQGKR